MRAYGLVFCPKQWLEEDFGDATDRLLAGGALLQIRAEQALQVHPAAVPGARACAGRRGSAARDGARRAEYHSRPEQNVGRRTVPEQWRVGGRVPFAAALQTHPTGIEGRRTRGGGLHTVVPLRRADVERADGLRLRARRRANLAAAKRLCK